MVVEIAVSMVMGYDRAEEMKMSNTTGRSNPSAREWDFGLRCPNDDLETARNMQGTFDVHQDVAGTYHQNNSDTIAAQAFHSRSRRVCC